MPNLLSLSASCVGLEPRPLSIGITRLQRYYGPPPHLARPVPRGRPVGLALDHVMGLPVLRLSSSSTHAVTNTPAEPQTALRSPSPGTTAFPVLTPDRLPHYRFRGLLGLHSHYGLHVRQVPYRTLYTRGFSRFVTSTTAPVAIGRSDSCRAGFAPAERQRLGTAHVNNRLRRGGQDNGGFADSGCVIHSGTWVRVPSGRHTIRKRSPWYSVRPISWSASPARG